MLSTNRGRVERIFLGGFMFAIATYLILLVLLIYWVERPTLIGTNSLNIQKNPGEALDTWLKNFNWSNRQEVQAEGRLVQYKFYTEVIETLLSLARRMGGNYQESLLHLREGLQADRQFEKKLKEMILGTWLQMGMMMVLTWTFIISALCLVDIKVPFIKLIFILCWQLLGVGCLPVILNYMRRFYFADIGLLWKMFYILKSLAKVPLSRSEIFTMAHIQELKLIKQKNLFSIVEKLKNTCQRALQMGGSYEEEVGYLMGELRFQEKWHFELFEKKLVMVKLGLLSVFFLPSYLAFIFVLLGDLLSLM